MKKARSLSDVRGQSSISCKNNIVFNHWLNVDLLTTAVVFVNRNSSGAHVSSQCLLAILKEDGVHLTNRWISSRQPSRSTEVYKHLLVWKQLDSRNLPAEGTITSVGPALRRHWVSSSLLMRLCECLKARALSRDIAIADIIVNVLPSPISSASIPPLGHMGSASLLVPTIVCS